VSTCRLCNSDSLELLFEYKNAPATHRLRRSKNNPDGRYDIHFSLCTNCRLLQIEHPAPVEELYENNASYITSFQKPAHLPELITSMLAHRNAGAVLEVGCNDGSFLTLLQARGYGPIAGVEPNDAAASIATAAGHDVRTGFFDGRIARALLDTHGAFDVIVARHVLEHVVALEPFFVSTRTALRDDGLFILELPLVEAGLDCGNPSILWEEHVSYFCRPHIEYMLARYGFVPLEWRQYAFGGGTVAVLAKKTAATDLPFTADWPSRDYFSNFMTALNDYTRGLKDTLQLARDRGMPVVLYGAAPRSCVVTAIAGIGGLIDFVIDDRAEMQAHLLPGTDLEIQPFAVLPQDTRHMLCLLGVGAENETAVTRKLAALPGGFTGISLFPPRDTVASIATAAERIKQRPTP